MHRHYCECGHYRTCSRPGCVTAGWECEDCVEERRLLFLLSREYARERDEAGEDTLTDAAQLPLENF